MKANVNFEAQAVNLLRTKLMREAEKELNVKMPLFDINYINSGRYAIMTFFSKTVKVRYAILFKKERFHSYGKIYKDTGEGETINMYEWKEYMKDCHKIIFAYQNTHSLEFKYIYPEQVAALMKTGKAYIHINQSDKKIQNIFSVRYLNDM